MTATPVLTRLSKTLSYVLHPLLVPTIGVALLMFGNTIFSNIETNFKWFFLGTVFLNTLAIPAFCIGILHKLRVIPDLKLTEPRQRIIPMLIVAISYVVCALMLNKVIMAYLIKRFLMAALGCVMLGLIITPFWKISLHMISAGGLLAMLFLMNYSGFGNFMYTLLVFIVLSGALGTARLYLGYHNILQVCTGFVAGFLIAFVTILYL